ncbi:MAG: hypothetical protein ABSE91_03050 [Patescibacteria group bacterium]|jgi:hypothetical protein
MFLSRGKGEGSKFLRFLVYFLVLAIVVAFGYPQLTRATASITAISDTMSRDQISQNSSHAIKFTTGGAIAISGDTIAIVFPSDFNFTSAVSTDLTFTHGSSTGLEHTSTIVAGAPGSATWGAVFSGTSNRTLTLTAPTSADPNPIAANDKLIISYASTHAVNGSTATTYLPTIQLTGTDCAAGPTSYAITLLTNDQVTVSTTIDPYLTLTLTTTSVSLTKSGGGNPTYQSGGTGYNQSTANTLAAGTNGTSGYTITYNGDTLKSGSNSIAAMASAGASSYGTAQFGINLEANTTPSTGANPTGSGSGTPASDYGTANSFRYVVNTATPLASASAPTASNTFTVSYIANVASTTPAGAYSTTITYICTGNF